MSKLQLSDVDFHDAWLLGLVYDRLERSARMSISSFMDRDKRAVRVDLEFQRVALLLSTDLEPWGPSGHLYSATQEDRLPVTPSEAASCELGHGERVLHIVTQSGDDIFVAYGDVDVSLGEIQ